MTKTCEYKDPRKVKLINELREASRENNVRVWRVLAEDLSSSRKNMRTVNIQEINKHTEKGDTVIVPGKLLGDGALDHKVEVAAFNLSESARKKIEGAGGKVISISKLMKKNPKGSGIITLG